MPQIVDIDAPSEAPRAEPARAEPPQGEPRDPKTGLLADDDARAMGMRSARWWDLYVAALGGYASYAGPSLGAAALARDAGALADAALAEHETREARARAEKKKKETSK